MMYARLSLGVMLLLAPLVRTEELISPKTIAPQVCLAQAVEKDGIIEIHVCVPSRVSEMVAVNVPSAVNAMPTGEVKAVIETRYKAFLMSTVLVADGKEVRITRKDGKAVDPKDLPKLLSKETPVLVFTEGEIDPYYLRVVQDDVLIIVIPAGQKFPGRTKADD